MGVQNPNERPKPSGTVLRRTATQPTVKQANENRSNQIINRITRSNPQAAKVVSQGVKKASAQPKHPNLIDHVLSDVGNAAGAVGKEVGKLGQVHDTLSRQQTENLRNYPKQLGEAVSAIRKQQDKQQLEGGGGEQFITGLGRAAAATAQHPLKVGKATVKSIPGAVEGLVAGPVLLAEKPGSTIKGVIKDYNARYGKDAGKAVQQEGLLPYALDAATAAVPIGRMAGAAAKARGAEVMAERPGLRVSPDRVVPQDRSPNLFKAVAQSVEDKTREKATLKRQNKGTPRGIEPQGPNEVVPRYKHTANKKLSDSYGVRSGVNYNQFAQAREVLRGTEKQVKKTLTKDQINHGALRYAVEHGIRTPQQATEFLPKLKALIEENRTKTPLHDELPHIQWLIDHPHVFDQNLAPLADQMRELGKKLGAEDPRLKPKQQAVRDVTPQSILLGTGERVKNERVKSFEKRVAAARKEAGLTEPGYFPHRDMLRPRFADYTRGQGVHGAVKGHKETSYALMKEGAAVVHPQALTDALARNLKNRFQVNHVADTTAGFAVTKLTNAKTGEAIHLHPSKATYHDVERALEESGVKDLVAYRPQTIYKAMHDQAEHPENPVKFLADAYKTATDPAAFRNKSGWVLIPKEIDKQMKDSLKHNGFFSRLLAKNKSFNTKMILGLNPSWPVMRIGHNLGSSALFGVNPLKAIEASRNLSPEQMKALNAWVGSDALHFDRTPPRMGAAAKPESLTDALRTVALSDTKTGKAIRAANPATWVNQLTRPAMAVERNQMAFFRRAAAYQKLSKDAKAKVNKDFGGFISTVAQARDELLKDPQYMETLAHHVNEVFGDFNHYSGLQRTAQQNLMFYGFLRYATRVVLKDLPVKHPIKANILLNLSRQNERNTRDILGLGPNDPLPFGADANVYTRDKNGNLSAQSLHRLNPFGAVTLETADDPRRMLTSSLPLAPSELATQAFNVDLLRRHGLRVNGQAAEKGFGDSISAEDRARIALADFLKQIAPYRVVDNAKAAGRKMGNDSLAFSQRPILHKQTQAIANDIVAENFGKKIGPVGEILKAELPFVKLPSRDDMLALQAKQNAERLAGKHLSPQQKAAEEKKIRSQPGYAKAEQKARVLSRQRSKHRGRHASAKPFSIDDTLNNSTNAIDSILP